MARVADYSAGRPGAKNLKITGFIGAVRYIGQPGWTKNTDADEFEDFIANELDMALVFELSAGDWRGGFAAGARNARAARAHADAIGFPRDRPIYMAIDQDVVTEAEYEQVESYLDGAASVLGKDLTGPYGEYEVCRRSWEWGYRWQWQCRAWSGTPVEHFANRRLYQYFGHPESGPNGGPGPNIFVGGIEVDTNEVNAPDWGQSGGLDMFTDEDRKLITETRDAVRAAYDNDYAAEPRNIGAQVADQGKSLFSAYTDDPVVGSEVGATKPSNIGDKVKEIRDGVRELQKTGVPVSLTEADRADIADRVQSGLLTQLAPLFDLARRLES